MLYLWAGPLCAMAFPGTKLSDKINCPTTALRLPAQVHRGIKGVVKDMDGNGIKGATIAVRGVRKDVTTGKKL